MVHTHHTDRLTEREREREAEVKGELNNRKYTQRGNGSICEEKHLQDKVMGERNLEVGQIRWEVVFISQCSNVRME